MKSHSCHYCLPSIHQNVCERWYKCLPELKLNELLYSCIPSLLIEATAFMTLVQPASIDAIGFHIVIKLTRICRKLGEFIVVLFYHFTIIKPACVQRSILQWLPTLLTRPHYVWSEKPVWNILVSFCQLK